MPLFGKFYSLVLLVPFLSFTPSLAQSAADGPDFYRLNDVASHSALNMRSGPNAASRIVGKIPADADGLADFGCVGGLDADQSASATAAQRQAALKTRWCKIGYKRIIGWSAAQFLTEGTGPDAFNGGGRLSALAGSEWQLRDFAGVPVTENAWIAFKGDDLVSGLGGCNRFSGKVSVKKGKFSIGPLAMTKMACPPEMMETEQDFSRALAATQSITATHLILALFDKENQLLATLTRRDAD
ncbi:META domain-containing protein [Sneathiella marina]|uniref:META domain-containing protein n=1 Tax=Sneathiella marina TaxID=2950108 RepID=A0ABY4W8A0_9PROT|nr:META domain-containing protein [Sneathiella marina]USG61975.1 META domain-containing protein [Sneathiella marina]